jgi:polysaccharide export outer membrane protein
MNLTIRTDVHMRHLKILYFLLAAIFIFTSCSDKQYQALFQERKSISDTLSQKNPVTLNEYRIKSQDILQVRNLQDTRFIANETPVNPNTTGGSTVQGETFQVEEDGTVTLPVIGHVQVTGLTRSEAQKLIEGLYRKTLLKDPIIELKIVNLKVTILGEIKGQGSYTLIKDKTTLVELIGEAGGLTDRANEKNIKIIRGTEKNPKVTEVDLNNIQSINDPGSVLQSGDIIYVAENKRAARGENLQNFSTIFQPILILFNTALILYTLIHK